MNIFYLHEDPIVAASYLVDKHVVKMGLESVQMLSTAHRVMDGIDGVLPDEREDILYKATHRNHPCNIWIRESVQNYLWLVDHAYAIFDRYSNKSGKTHKSSRLMLTLQSPPYSLKYYNLTTPAQAIPEHHRGIDPVEAYRSYYKFDKAHLHQWTYNSKPTWI